MNQKTSLITIALALACFISCKTDKKNKTQHSEQKVEKDCKDIHWSHHDGDDGPENWKNLCVGFSECGGKSQSPIDINTESIILGEGLSAPIFDYGTSKVDIINNEHTVQFNIEEGSKVNLNGKDYQLIQFHYHALSEHTIDGEHFPLEVHFVHKHSDTDFAVLGVMFDEGGENELFKKYLSNFPTSKGEYKSDDIINLMSLLPENKNYYYYSGSLTTPPCTEVVSWFVLENPIEASKEQIEEFSKILNNNYRPTMALNSRDILLYSE
jgi:carbonic anhydrase